MDGIAFHTPDYDGNAPVVCRRLALPSFLWPLFNGAFGSLLEEENWVTFGNMPIDDVIQAYQAAFDDMRPCSMIGAIIPFSAMTLPDNCLPCDGSEYQAVDYPELFSILPGSLQTSKDTFVTPNLLDRFLVGVGTSTDVGDIGGEGTVTLGIEHMPAHSHGYNEPIPNIDIEAPGAPDILAAGVGPIQQTTEVGGGEPHNNLPPFFTVLYGIVAK